MLTFPNDVDGWLSEAEGKLLAELASGHRVLEVGCFAGRSTICMAQTANAVFCCDTFDGRATPKKRRTLEEFVSNLERYGVASKCSIHVGDNRVLVPSFRECLFGMIFIDADHSYEAVMGNIIDCLAVLAPGGILAFHDYRRPENPDVTRAVDDWRLGRPVTLLDTVAWFQM